MFPLLSGFAASELVVDVAMPCRGQRGRPPPAGSPGAVRLVRWSCDRPPQPAVPSPIWGHWHRRFGRVKGNPRVTRPARSRAAPGSPGSSGRVAPGTGRCDPSASWSRRCAVRRRARVGLASPGACLAWLHASHRPWPLSPVVRPPSAAARAWSRCRIGASHHGVRQNRSRRVTNRRSELRNSRACESIATSSPDVGSAYSRRIQTRSSREHGTRDDLAGQLGGDGTVVVDVGRLVAGAEQSGVGHHQAEVDRARLALHGCPRARSRPGCRPRAGTATSGRRQPAHCPRRGPAPPSPRRRPSPAAARSATSSRRVLAGARRDGRPPPGGDGRRTTRGRAGRPPAGRCGRARDRPSARDGGGLPRRPRPPPRGRRGTGTRSRARSTWPSTP